MDKKISLYKDAQGEKNYGAAGGGGGGEEKTKRRFRSLNKDYA